MFPDWAEMDRTLAIEDAVSAAYELATSTWAAQIEPLLLPTLDGGLVLPPDPDAVVSRQALAWWEQQIDEVIAPSVGLVWSYQFARTLWRLGVPDTPTPVTASGTDQDFEDWLLARWEARNAAGTARSTARAQAARGPRGLPYGPQRTPDMVAELVALAWDTNPTQIKMAGELVWDRLTNRRRLEMFLGSYSPQVGKTLPSRLRDLLVGTTNRASRLAIPVPELRAQLSSWMTGKFVSKGKPTGRWFVKGDGRVTYNTRRQAERAAKGKPIFEEVGPEVTPLSEAWNRYRDLARSGGLDTAGILNHAVLTAASMSDTPFDKVWCAHMDKRTRDSHFAADGQQVPVDAKFRVGGSELDFPGDPGGPPKEVVNCRCRVGMNSPGAPLPKEQKRNSAQRNEIIHRQRQGIIRAREDPQGWGVVPDTAITAAATEETQMDDTIIDGEKTVNGETFLTFTDALFAVTGVPTDDRRMLAANIELKMRDFPMPLLWQEKTGDGHRGSVGIGVIESMTYENGEVRGSGYLLNNENAAKALDLIAHGVANPSIDMADATGTLAYADGSEVTEDNFDEAQPMFEAYTRGTITAATIVSIPAFGQTRLSLNAEREPRLTGLEDALVAAARYQQPVYDPALFADADPNLLAAHRLRCDPDTGHVYGFIARWTDQHRSVGLGNIRPPRSETGYEHFHTSPGVQLTDGRTLPVGRLTVGIGHAPTRGVSAAAAQAHYDNVDACWALGRVSEHRLGLYFSGVVAPWASPEKVQMGLASPVSGDWRPIGPNRNLELVAVLSVNTPGFLCKVETDAAGDPLAMVASMGAVDTDPAATLTLDGIRAMMHQVLDERMEFAAKDKWKLGDAADCPDKKPFAVVSTETGKTVGCHATEREARQHLSDLIAGKATAAAQLDVDVLSDRARALLGAPPREPVLTPTERMSRLLADRGGQ